MRKRLRMTYWKNETGRNILGHYHMNYFVTNVVDLDNNNKLTDNYVFENSTIFKGKRFKLGDIIEVTLTIENEGTEGLKLLRPHNIVKINKKSSNSKEEEQ